jgi:hypothetical protein
MRIARFQRPVSHYVSLHLLCQSLNLNSFQFLLRLNPLKSTLCHSSIQTEMIGLASAWFRPSPQASYCAPVVNIGILRKHYAELQAKIVRICKFFARPPPCGLSYIAIHILRSTLPMTWYLFLTIVESTTNLHFNVTLHYLCILFDTD